MKNLPSTFLILLHLLSPGRAQGPTDPTGCTTGDLPFGVNPHCTGAPSSFPIFGCDRISVMGMLPSADEYGLFTYVTGLTDPATGREFALQACEHGLLVVDAHGVWSPIGPTGNTPPSFWFPDAVPSLWRGAVAYGRFIYEGSILRNSIRVFEVLVNPGGTPVVDVVARGSFLLANPPLPIPGLVGSSYRLTVDGERGLLYVTGSELSVYDINNPLAPALVAKWKGVGATRMATFDVHLFKDPGGTRRAAISEYFGPYMAILDVSTVPTPANPNLNWQPPACYWNDQNQNAWMSPDKAFMYCSMGNWDTRVYDMQAFNYATTGFISAPTTLSYRYPDTSGGRHHLSLQGNGYTGFASSFQDGLILYDLRPSAVQPTLALAHLDTTVCMPSTCALSFEGNFAVYRNQDSGVLYVSDTSNGLYFVRANVGQVNRYGSGVPEVQTGVARLPRISLEDAPPRTPGTFDQILNVTISGLWPGRWCVVEMHAEGRNAAVPYPYAPAFPQWGGGGSIGSFICGPSNADGVIVTSVSTFGVADQMRVFLQAYSYALGGGGAAVCVAASRGAFFGFASRQ